MTIKLYKTTSEPIKVSKELTNEKIMTGNLKEECSILSPSIMIQSDESIFTYNYAYIDEFLRYYFITDIVCVRNGLYRLSLKVDVLTTYQEEIKSLKAVISRQQNTYNLYLNDGEFKTYNKHTVVTKKFPNNPTGANTLVLTVVGGD